MKKLILLVIAVSVLSGCADSERWAAAQQSGADFGNRYFSAMAAGMDANSTTAYAGSNVNYSPEQLAAMASSQRAQRPVTTRCVRLVSGGAITCTTF